MSKFTEQVKAFKDRVLREPVLLFGLIPLYLAAFQEQMINDELEVAFWAGVTLYLQRTFSTSKIADQEGNEVSRFIGAVEERDRTLDGG